LIRLTVSDRESVHSSYGRLSASSTVKVEAAAPSVVVVMRCRGNPGMPIADRDPAEKVIASHSASQPNLMIAGHILATRLGGTAPPA
jgi:hypothetical protein